MNKGHVKLYRKITDSGLFSYGLKAGGFFAWLLVNANYRAAKWRGEWVHPGEIITSINNLSGVLSESPKVIRRLIDVLEAEGMIKKDVRANKWTKLTLCNWASYQSLPCQQGKLKANSGNNKGNNKGNPIKEVKKERILIPRVREREKIGNGKEVKQRSLSKDW